MSHPHPVAHQHDHLAHAPRPDGAAGAMVRRRDRLVDLAAALLLGAGIAFVAVGRRALEALAAGTYAAPVDGSWVARTDYHAAQVRWGAWLVAAGIGVAAVAALRHLRHRRRTR